MRPAIAAGLVFVMACALGAERRGLRPRGSHTQYPVTVFDEFVAIAAEQLAPERVRQQFGSDLDGAYLVVEVCIYPRDRKSVEIRQGDFALRVNRTNEMLQAAFPSVTAAAKVTTEVSARALPATTTSRPVAGYLYFPVTEQRIGKHEYELEYKVPGHWMIIPLEPSSRR